MALSRRPFAEVYRELTEREPSAAERLLDVNRSEVAARRAIEGQADEDLQDMLHVAGVWIGEKKRRAAADGSNGLSQRALTLCDRERSVWLPAPPLYMPSGCRPSFPKAAAASLFEEEAELRRWLYGVQNRLRANIERACQECFYLLHCMDQLTANEVRGRTRLMHEEAEAWPVLRRQVFRETPADFFRAVVVDRYGATATPATDAEDAALADADRTVEELEERARAQLADEEAAARQSAHQLLVDAYDTQLFMVNHQEVIGREELVTQETNALYPLMALCCREDFGFVYYHTPAVLLHAWPRNTEDKARSVLMQVCLWHMAKVRARTAQEMGCLQAFEEEAPAGVRAAQEDVEYPVEPTVGDYPTTALTDQVPVYTGAEQDTSVTGTQATSTTVQQSDDGASAETVPTQVAATLGTCAVSGEKDQSAEAGNVAQAGVSENTQGPEAAPSPEELDAPGEVKRPASGRYEPVYSAVEVVLPKKSKSRTPSKKRKESKQQ